MRIDSQPNPLNLAGAYRAGALAQAARPAAVHSAAAAGRIDRVNRAERAINSRVSRLVAAVVPGRVDFSGDLPIPASNVRPIYRRPADRNAVATAIRIGQRLDVTG